jgi:hypothetical protein
MSVTHSDGSFNSGRTHLKPALTAIVITAAIVVLTLALCGPLH